MGYGDEPDPEHGQSHRHHHKHKHKHKKDKDKHRGRKEKPQEVLEVGSDVESGEIRLGDGPREHAGRTAFTEAGSKPKLSEGGDTDSAVAHRAVGEPGGSRDASPSQR